MRLLQPGAFAPGCLQEGQDGVGVLPASRKARYRRRSAAGARCGVKAAGDIRTLAGVKAMLEADANRIGASASVATVRELGAE
jgi:deoxyribose-phosphate aldolase